jgi:hypothetical protein
MFKFKLIRRRDRTKKNFKYGDVLGIKPWHILQSNLKQSCFRFRIDPVPGVHKYGSYARYYRKLRTTQEKRWNIPHREYVRPKRKNLPDFWDDYYISKERTKSWKRTKKKKQWM